MRLPFVGSIALIGVTLTTLPLQPARAQLLDFQFSFSEGNKSVAGIIRGLENNKNNQVPSQIEVTSSSIGGVGLYGYDSIGSGFDVISGSISTWSWRGSGPLPNLNYTLTFDPNLGIGVHSENVLASIRGVPVFAPAPAPGPLPILGAVAAFGFSRKLRKQIKATRTTVPTPPAG